MQRLVPQLVLEALAVADVDEDALDHGRAAVGVPRDDGLVVDDPHHPPVARDEAVLPASVLLGPVVVLRLGEDHPVAVAGVHAAHPHRRIGGPLVGRVSEQLGDLRAHEVPATVLARLGHVDHARDALDDGPILRLRHDELVGEALLPRQDPLAVDEEERLAHDDRHDDRAQGQPHREAHLLADHRRAAHDGDPDAGRDDGADERNEAAQGSGDGRVLRRVVLLVGPVRGAVRHEERAEPGDGVEEGRSGPSRAGQQQPEIADRADRHAADGLPRSDEAEWHAGREGQHERGSDDPDQEGEVDEQLALGGIDEPGADDDDRHHQAAEDRDRVEVQHRLVDRAHAAVGRGDVGRAGAHARER